MTMFKKILTAAAAAILAVVLFGREQAAEWVEAAWRFFTTGAFAMLLAVGVVAGCAADGGYVGPQTAPFLEADTYWFSWSGMPTAVPKDSTAAGFRDGDVQDIYSWMKGKNAEGTGWPARILALGELSIDAQKIIAQLYLCEAAPDHQSCTGVAPAN